MGVSFETYLRRHWDVQRDVAATSPRGLNAGWGGVRTSSSQGQELRDTRQLYQQKEKESVKKEPHDDLSNVIRLQGQGCRLISTISIICKSYQVFLGNDVQLQDVELFCCNNNGILSVDTTLNGCDRWVTDTCYYNKSLANSDGHNPVFLGPTWIHFQKYSSIFRRFLLEMCAHNPKIRDLRTIRTDQEMTIFDGFCSILSNLNLLLCVYHLKQGDKQKISNLVRQKGAKQASCRYDGVQEYGLADSTDLEDFHAKLESLQEERDRLCPGFHKWFCEKRKPIFV